MNKEQIKEKEFFTPGVNKEGQETITITVRNYRWLIIVVALIMFGLGRLSGLTSFVWR